MAIAKVVSGWYVVYNVRSRESLDASLKALMIHLEKEPAKHIRIFVPRIRLTKNIESIWVKKLKERFPDKSFTIAKYGIRIIEPAPGVIEFYGIIRTSTEVKLSRVILYDIITNGIKKGIRKFKIILPKGKSKYVAMLIDVIRELKGNIAKTYGWVDIELTKLYA